MTDTKCTLITKEAFPNFEKINLLQKQRASQTQIKTEDLN